MTTVDGGTPQEVEILDADSALSELHRTHYRSCLRIAALLVDDPGSAEEVVQEAFVKVYRAWDKVRDMHAAPAYLRVVVVNTARSRLFKELRIQFVSPVDSVAVKVAGDDQPRSDTK